MRTEQRRDGTSSSSGKQIAMSSSWSSSSRELPDELVLEIISRLGTLNEAVRCSSLVSKRWRNLWRSIKGGVLDFDKSHELQRRNRGIHWRVPFKAGEQLRFAITVDQALTSLGDDHKLDSLRIGFDLYCIGGKAWRWIEFGLTNGVKELAILSSFALCLPLLTIDSLAKHDLSRLEILEFQGVDVPRAVIEHILSNCSSLRHFALRHCTSSKVVIEEEVGVITICASNNLHSLSLDFERLGSGVRIDLLSAPSLRTFQFDGARGSHVEFGDDLPRLQEATFGGPWLRETRYLPWSRAEFDKFAPRLDRLGFQLGPNHFRRRHNPPPEWLLFAKLRVLELSIYTCFVPSSLLDCTVLLMAAPVLRRLSICVVDADDPTGWEKPRSTSTAEPSTWKHHSLEVLQLHGVHRTSAFPGSARRFRLELAACIIMNAPSLKQVLIDTRDPGLIHQPAAEYRLPDEVDEDIRKAKMELETQLQGCSASSQIHFTYR